MMIGPGNSGSSSVRGSFAADSFWGAICELFYSLLKFELTYVDFPMSYVYSCGCVSWCTVEVRVCEVYRRSGDVDVFYVCYCVMYV